MPYRLKINGLQYQSEIEGSQEWSRSVVRDFNDRLFRTRGEYRFKGHKGLYNLLYNHLSINGVCESLEGRIYFNTGASWDYEWRGDILPQDFEFDLLKRSADGQILDASWSAKFNNSDEQKVFLLGATSNSGASIPPCINENAYFFDPITGNYSASTTRSFKVSDVFTYLVGYYTNDTVTFASDYYTTGDGSIRYITTGLEIRENNLSANPEISFSELFNELNKIDNIWIIVEQDDLDNPVIRVEPYDYIFKNEKLLEIRDPENITLKTDLNQLYSNIVVGADTTPVDFDNDASHAPGDCYGWEESEYNVSGACAFENNELDLVNSWRIDHNSIQKQLSQNGDAEGDYDDDIFIFDAQETLGIVYAIEYSNEYAPSATSTYNQTLTNCEKLDRWIVTIGSSLERVESPRVWVRVNEPIQSFYDDCDVDNGCAIFFDDDTTPPNEDLEDLFTTYTEGGGSLGNKTNDFKPTVKGWYKWYTNIPITGREGGGGVLTSQLVIYQDDTQTNPIQIIEIDTLVSDTGTLLGGATAYMDIGNVGVVRVESSTDNRFFISRPTSYLTIENTTVATLPEPTSDPLIYIYEASRHAMSRTDFDTLDQGRGFVRIIDTHGEKYYDCWAKDVQWNGNTCTIESGEFIGGRPPTELCWVLETGVWDDDCYWLDSKYIPN